MGTIGILGITYVLFLILLEIKDVKHELRNKNRLLEQNNRIVKELEERNENKRRIRAVS